MDKGKLRYEEEEDISKENRQDCKAEEHRQVGSLNIGTMTSKGRELVDIIDKRTRNCVSRKHNGREEKQA